jgi:hypothetical protein
MHDAEPSLDLVGNIRLASVRRLRYLLATLDSLAFIANRIGLYLNIENGRHLASPLSRRLRHLGFHRHCLTCETADYGDVYRRLLAKSTAAFLMHLEEDHFCVLDDWTVMDRIIRVASTHSVDAAVMTGI